MAKLPAYMLTPITDAVSADAFTRAAVADGKAWHYDDHPRDIIPAFTSAEVDALELRRAELHAIPDYDPFAILVFLTNSEPEILALDTESIRVHSEGLNAEQRECLHDDSRRDEAMAMVDDLQARCGFAADVCAAARLSLES